MPTLVELREELAAKSRELHEIFEQAGPEYDFSKAERLKSLDADGQVKEVKRRNDELTDLGKKVDAASEIEGIGKKAADLHGHFNLPAAGGGITHPSGNGTRQPERKSLSEMLTEHKGDILALVEKRSNQVSFELPVDFKTLVTLSTISPQNERDPLVNMALEDRTIADLMGEAGVAVPVIEYYEETTFTNAAASVAEGGTLPESAVAYTLRTETVRDVGHFIPATRQSLADNAFLEGELRNRLTFGARRAEEAQLLSGTGVAPQITGLLNRSGIQTQALGADPGPDAIFKAMQKVRGAAGQGFAEPTAVAMNPNNWTSMRLLRSAADLYIWGSPADPNAMERIWGKEIRQTTAMTAGTALTGAFRPYAIVRRRQGIVVELSTEHSTFFVEGKVAIRATSRLALEVTRPSAFATITGLA
jgi:HK97 family phage major capsid protein